MPSAENPTVYVSPRAKIGSGVSIGNFTSIYDNVVIGDGVAIGDHCSVGIPIKAADEARTLTIGSNSTIRSHAVLYEGSQLGEGLQTGHHVIIRERTRCGRFVSVGSYSSIEGDCEIGDCSRLHSYVHVGKGSAIGRFVWLFSLVTLTNDALPPFNTSEPVTIEDGALVLVGCTVFPGTIMKTGSYAAAGTHVRGVVEVGQVVAGPECRVTGHVTGLMHMGTMQRLPWMSHLLERYPPEFHNDLRALHELVKKSRFSA